MAAESGAFADHVTVIRSGRSWAPFSLREIWSFRHFLTALVWRDITIRYKQTVIGILWAVIQPLLMMILLTVVFERMVGIDSAGIPYPLFSYSALLAWNLFARGISSGSTSLVTNEAIITKVYFPRLLVPASSIVTAFVDYLIAFILLGPLFWWYDVAPRATWLFFPLLALLNILVALGFALFLSILDAIYRDVRMILPFLTQLLFFMTPVVYSSSKVPARFELLYWMNPMTAVVEGTRWALFDYPAPEARLFAVSLASGLLLFTLGLAFFLRLERKIVDRI